MLIGGDNLPYAVAVQVNLVGVVAQIREIEVEKGKHLIFSKFIPFQSEDSKISEGSSLFLSHPKISHALKKAYGTLTYKDLLNGGYSIDREVVELLNPLLNKAAIQCVYLFNYLVNQQDFNYTNCLFRLDLNSQIKPIVIDLERAFTCFPCSKGEMYRDLFK